MSDSHASHEPKTCMMQHQSLTPSYHAMITSMRARYPNLASLDDELSKKSKDPESGRAAVLEFYPDCVKRQNFQTSNDLLKYVESVNQNNDTCKRRLYLLEGLPRNYIEILGSQLKIEPYLFAQQLRRVIWDDNNRVGNSPLLPSHPSAASTLALQYFELRDFGDQISDFEVTCFNQPRGISVTKVRGEFDGVGIVPKMATFWYERKVDDEWDGEFRRHTPLPAWCSELQLTICSIGLAGSSSWQYLLGRGGIQEEALHYGEWALSGWIC